MSKTVASASLDQRLERLERRMASQRTQVARRSRVSAIIAFILLVLVGVYFSVGYMKFVEVTRPEMVVQVAEGLVDQNLPELRRSLQAEIVRSAPGWAGQLSGEIQTGMPKARDQLENYIVDQMDAVLHETNTMTKEEFRTFLKENRPLLEQGFRDLASSPTVAEETMQNVIDALDKQLAKQMQVESSDLFDTVSQMKKKLDRLAAAQNLSYEQQLERRMLMLTRRLQLETVEPQSSAGQIAGSQAAAVTPVAAALPDAAAGGESGAPESSDAPAKAEDEDKPDGESTEEAASSDKDAKTDA